MTLHGQVQDPPTETAGVEARNPLNPEPHRNLSILKLKKTKESEGLDHIHPEPQIGLTFWHPA